MHACNTDFVSHGVSKLISKVVIQKNTSRILSFKIRMKCISAKQEKTSFNLSVNYRKLKSAKYDFSFSFIEGLQTFSTVL